jgi:hypothetical protein
MCADTLTRIRTRFIRQDEPGIKKEWFHSSKGELLLRRAAASGGEIVAFELAFDRAEGTEQHYVRWEKGRPARTGAVDPGDRPGKPKMSPIVTLHAAADPCVLKDADAFVSDRRRKLPQAVRDFVLERLEHRPS